MQLPTTHFMKQLQLTGPVVAAPLGGGPTTPELVAAVSNQGALGSLAAAYLTAPQIDDAVEKLKRLTNRPYAINLFTPMPVVALNYDAFERALRATRTIRQSLAIEEPQSLTPPYHPNFDEQFKSVLKAKPKAFSFIFGMLDAVYLKECKSANILTMGTATTLEEAMALEASGVDAVVAQGVEAGAHHGMFSPESDDPGLKTIDLTRACSSKLGIPVIAAGGIMTGADIARALRAGAQAAMLGTAFLLCPEAGTSKAYRAALRDDSLRIKTRLTRAFSGRLARGIENQFMIEVERHPGGILPFPAQNAFTRDIRNQATRLERTEYLSLWAGMGASQLRELPAADLVRALFKELEEAS